MNGKFEDMVSKLKIEPYKDGKWQLSGEHFWRWYHSEEQAIEGKRREIERLSKIYCRK